MANRNFKEKLLSFENGLVAISGRFAPNGSSAPADVVGKGFTVTRTGTGVFRITLQDKYTSLLSAGATICLATPADQIVMIKAHDVSGTTPYVDIALWDISDAAVADHTYAAGDQIHFLLMLKNSSV